MRIMLEDSHSLDNYAKLVRRRSEPLKLRVPHRIEDVTVESDDDAESRQKHNSNTCTGKKDWASNRKGHEMDLVFAEFIDEDERGCAMESTFSLFVRSGLASSAPMKTLDSSCPTRCSPQLFSPFKPVKTSGRLSSPGQVVASIRTEWSFQ